ncbi:fluoride efflux transporter CrcB [Sphingosinicella rhizophila]|uniref:Fluoride-specific ion channel FluC n=1 Tax=Sphingosinicella rhizophila TaxID=3050082 RepID=A0ABU3Q7D3_9SPHN|nr:fluoride efflux transporter CrcB [Sphingosinicella sp. GR2756]MDT9599232.1 fluoride efflux transporter CrcB [Sphingosinicella sp. GR2756]
MPQLLLVMFGGAVGAGLRYQLGRMLLRLFGPGFPWGTLAVNLLGGLLMGILAGVLFGEGVRDRPLWLLLGVGLLGGFTTFSAFSFDLFAMIERGAFGTAAGYALLSVLASLLLLYAGFWLTRSLL